METPMLHFPLGRAMVCCNCEAVFAAQRVCPACTSDHMQAIETFLSRRQGRHFEALVHAEMEAITR